MDLYPSPTLSNASLAIPTSLLDATLNPPTDEAHCSLLGPVGLVVQGVMGFLVIATLLFKRSIEHPKRPWKIWMADTSKQFIGQAIVHTSNILISTFPNAPSTPPSLPIPSGPNPCSLYFLNVLIDTTLGVLIIMFILRLSRYLLVDKAGFKGWNSGVYREEGDSGLRWDWWAKQTAVYVSALLAMKGVVILIFELLPVIFDAGAFVLSWLGPKGQVVFVMAIFPLAMNVFQFLALDSVLKHKTPKHGHTSSTSTDSDDPPSSPSYAALPSSDPNPPPLSPRQPNPHRRLSSSHSPRADEVNSFSISSGTDASVHGGAEGGQPGLLRNRSNSGLNLEGEETRSLMMRDEESQIGSEESTIKTKGIRGRMSR